MPFNNHNRSLLSLVHHTERDLHYLLDLSRDLKRAKYSGIQRRTLAGKNIALIFEKTSTRTRCAFEVAAYDEGAHVTYIDPTSSQIGHKESMKDTARVLGRMYDAIEYRGSSQHTVEELAEFAGVPVFNGLTDEFHPTQMLADVLTMTEHCSKPLHQISYAFVGDGRNNVANSLLLVGAKLGMDTGTITPLLKRLEHAGFVTRRRDTKDERRVFVDLTSAGPNRVFGIEGKGRIALGYDADFTLVDLKAKRIIRNEDQATRAGWTPFDGFEAQGWPMATIIRGMQVMRDGQVTTPSAGAPLRFMETLAA